MNGNTIAKRPPEIQKARNTLRGKGWTIVAAANRIGVTREHLSMCLNNRRQSRRIMAAIEELPENPNPA